MITPEGLNPKNTSSQDNTSSAESVDPSLSVWEKMERRDAPRRSSFGSRLLMSPTGDFPVPLPPTVRGSNYWAGRQPFIFNRNNSSRKA